jgi:hypothetical protein
MTVVVPALRADRERLEDGVLVIAHDHVHDRQLVLSGRPEGVREFLQEGLLG